MSPNPLYSNAPIAIVLLEVRHPVAEPPAGAAMAAIKQALAAWTPVERSEQGGVQIDLQTGQPTSLTVNKLVSRDLHTAVTFRPDGMVVEVTSYQGWEHFREVVSGVLRARQDIAPVDGVERVGLRYIDEVRVPPADRVDWSEWVSSSLLGPQDQLSNLGFTAEQQQHVVLCTTSAAGQSLTLRYGASRGAVVQTTPTLARATEPADSHEEFFLIDTDGAWVDSAGGIPELDVDSVLATCDRLHAPIRELFETLITDKLRKEVLAR